MVTAYPIACPEGKTNTVTNAVNLAACVALTDITKWVKYPLTNGANPAIVG
jgi:hypothetical protein